MILALALALQSGHSVPASLIRSAGATVGRLAPRVPGYGRRAMVVVFLEEGCPCCRSGRPYLDRVYGHYGDTVDVVGVMPGADARAIAAWRKRTTASFPVVPDPGGRLARGYGAVSALHTAWVGRNGRILAAWPGYSAPMLRELTARIERANRLAPRRMDVRPAPASLTSGCALAL